MSNYWTHEHPRAFEGMSIRRPEKEGQVACPKCKGYGSWHLKHDEHGYFDSSCSNCNGWGYVDPDSLDSKCIHEWEYLSIEMAKELGQKVLACYSYYECKNGCGKIIIVDSSD